MLTKISIVIQLLEKTYKKIPIKPKKGVKVTYSYGSMLVFFVVVMLKQVHSFKGMEKFAQKHYLSFGWQQAPSRKTIRRRFLSIPIVLKVLMPEIAKECAIICPQTFGFKWVFIDKSIFRAMGGLWHKTQMKLGIIAHSSIDKDASWAYSPYHRWRFGYGLHVIANENRFPIMGLVTTAKAKEVQQVPSLIEKLADWIGMIVGDTGYFATRVIQKVAHLGIFLFAHGKFTEAKTAFQKEYNGLVDTPQAKLLYSKRKPSIEPVFSIIKQLFQLSGQRQLPYKGLKKVEPFLMIALASIQIMMYLNFKYKQDLCKTDTLINII
jgi:hypothetical protein